MARLSVSSEVIDAREGLASLDARLDRFRFVNNTRSDFNNYIFTNSVIPVDDTIPQISEGAEIMSHVHTPLGANNQLWIFVIAHIFREAAAAVIGESTIALFKNPDADAIVAARLGGSGDPGGTIMLSQKITAGGTSPITFSVRLGSESVTNISAFNGKLARLYDTTDKSCIFVFEEFQP